MKLGIAGLAFIVAASCAPTPPRCPDRRDDVPNADESSLGSDCHRAGERLKALSCKQYRPDWDAFCETRVQEGVPLCPVKLSRIKSCDEINTICR